MPGHSTDASEIEATPQSCSDRICTAEETFRRIEPLLHRYGITRLARLTGLDRIGIPVWNAIAPNARSITISQGKGVTDIDAKVSAAMEALERAVAGDPDITIVNASWNNLIAGGHRADRLPALIGLGQGDLGEEEPMDWVTGVDIIGGGSVYVPRQAAVLDQTEACSRFWQSSDGLASGNSFEEAVLHGLLERIERDAYVLWQLAFSGRKNASCIDPAAFGDAVIADMLAKITAAGLFVRLFDMTSDIGVPCYTVLMAPRKLGIGSRFFDVTHGSGAHPIAVRAVIRAITEAAQSRLTFISGARDDIDPGSFDRLLPEEIRDRLMAIPAKAAPLASDLQSRGATSLLADTLAQLRRAGIDKAFAVPLTAPNAAFAVAKIFVPLLENPEGARKRRFGERAIAHSLRAG